MGGIRPDSIFKMTSIFELLLSQLSNHKFIKKAGSIANNGKASGFFVASDFSLRQAESLRPPYA